MQVEVDALGIDLGQEADEVLKAATQPVDRPARHHVDLPPGDHRHQRVEPGALVAALASRDAFVGEDGDDDPAQTVGDSLEFEALVLDGLAVGRDTKVKGDAFGHGRIIPVRERDFSSF